MSNDTNESGPTEIHDRGAAGALAALTSLQDWSKWLVGINAGVIGLLSLAVKDLASSFEYYYWLPISAVCCLIISVAAAAYLVGAIPMFLNAMHSGVVDEARFTCPRKADVHGFRTKFLPFPGKHELRVMAFLQHLTFVVGFILIGVSILVAMLFPAPTA